MSESGGNPEHQGPQSGGASVLPGARFGDVQLVRELGRGAQGVVYEGVQLSMDRRVAVKIMPRDTTFGTEQVDRFHREAEAAGRLSHPNIVSVYGFEESGGQLLLLQEMVTGGCLTDQLDDITDAQGDVQQACRRAAELLATLAEALHHAHEQGVVHRDIKPDNVLFSERGEPKIADFGLARVEDKLGLSQTGAIMGTPHYMSPEQVTADSGAIDARTDVYSLGCLLYRLITGQVPFHAKTLQGVFNDILNRAPRTPRALRPGVPPDLEAVCLKALEKEPDQRYASAREFAEDLQRFCVGETTLARPVSTLVRGVRSFQRQASSTLAMLVLLVPTAWIALDSLLLEPMARQRDELHPLRLGALALATLLLAWPSSLLARRLVKRSRRLAAGTAWALTLLLGAALALWVTNQRQHLLQGADRELLAHSLEQESKGSRPDVTDLQAYEQRWGDRFGPEDALLMARAYLERERPTQAAAWVGRLDPELAVSPVQDALLEMIYEALGDEAASAAAKARLADASAGADWSEWKLAADILRDMGHAWEARDAYLRAGRLPDAPRDELNLELSRVSADLCAWDEVGEYLDDYRKWFPDDPRGQLVLYQAAKGLLDWEGAGLALDSYTAHDTVSPLGRVELRHSFLLEQGQVAQAWDLVLRAIEQHGEDVSLQGWCAQQALERARAGQAEMRQWAALGNQQQLDAAVARARDALDRSEALYARLGKRPEGAFTGELGLSAVAIKRSELEPDRRLDLLRNAVEHALAARDLDDSYWQAHYNLGHARLSLARAEHGGFAALPLDVLREYMGHMRDAIGLNGLDHQLLNNAAWVQGRYVHDLTGDPADLEQALVYARRAVRLTDPDRAGGSCAPDLPARQAHSSSFDTLRTLQELAGDRDGALASARGALDGLLPGDPRYTARQAQVQRLQQASAGDR